MNPMALRQNTCDFFHVVLGSLIWSPHLKPKDLHGEIPLLIPSEMFGIRSLHQDVCEGLCDAIDVGSLRHAIDVVAVQLS